MKRYSQYPVFSFHLLLAVVLIFGLTAFPAPARADSTLTVNTNADDTTDDGLCTLREAITNANNDAATHDDCAAGTGNDTIVFADGIATIILAGTLPNITDFDGLTINGGGDITVDGSDTYRIILIDTGISLTLENLTIKDGACASCSGGGVYSSGGNLTITNSTFTSNQQGIYVFEGTLTITGSTFTYNSATYGGAVNVSGPNSVLTISNSVFTSNDSPNGSGSAIYNGGTMTVTNSSFTNNTGTSSNASSIFNDGNATIKNSTFSGTFGATTRAIYNNSATLTVSNSTFTGNEVSDYGGGILNAGGTLTIINSTFSGNKAPAGGADIYQSNSINSAILNLYNTILANENGGGNCLISAGTVNAANNLIEDSIYTCGLTNGVNGNIVGSDPNLGTLTGSPAYFPLNNGSPALNSGDNTICAADPVNNTSQNGVSRPQGAICDMGSFEKIVTITNVFKSNGAHDGWILESSETSGAGGSINSAASTLNVGDDSADRQYRSVLSFATGIMLPDNAVITKVTLKVRRNGVTGGGNPISLLQGFLVDVRKGAFGTSALAPGDFKASANKTVGPISPTMVSGWYSLDLTGAKNQINKLATGGGLTQIRLRFKLDDNDNLAANFLKLYSGNAGAARRPQLIIEYYVP